jgi:hypothetical protein
MIGAVVMKRLTAATLVCSALVFGGSALVGNSRAASGTQLSYICSAPDKQFITTVSTNLTQLGYWSDSLVSHEVAPAVVVKQTRSEAAQLAATRPQDRTLKAARDLLGSMFVEYSKAVALTARGATTGQHMQRAWQLAAASHKLLAVARDGLGRQGCDVSPLLSS